MTPHAPTQAHDVDALDAGNYEQAIATYAPGAGPLEALVWQAHTAVYLGRVEEAERVLGHIGRLVVGAEGDRGPKGFAARRRLLLDAELALERKGEASRALDMARRVIPLAETLKDLGTAHRGWVLAGRAARVSGEPLLALDALANALRVAEELGCRYRRAVSVMEFGLALVALGDERAAERRLREAIEVLSGSADPRSRVRAAVALGEVLSGRGADEEAYALVERAGTFEGCVETSKRRRLVIARALSGSGRAEEAVATAGPLEEDAREEIAAAAAIATARALILLGRFEEAGARAARAPRYAREADRSRLLVEAETLVGRSLSSEAPAQAQAQLRRAASEADDRALWALAAEARAALAEVLVNSDPLECERLLAEARRQASAARSPRATAEVQRVELARSRAAITVEEDGSLRVDPSRGWPTLKAAVAALEHYLVGRAVEETKGNLAAAGRLVGESRRVMSHYRKGAAAAAAGGGGSEEKVSTEDTDESRNDGARGARGRGTALAVGVLGQNAL